MKPIENEKKLDVNLNNERLLCAKKAANFLGLSRSKLYLEMDAGKLKYCKFGRSRRIRLSELYDYIARNEVGGEAI